MLIEILGDVGSGKTLLETILACVADAENIPIYANYNLNLKNYHPLKPEMLNALRGMNLVLIDEAYTFLEARRSGNALALYMSYILFQSRKRGMNIILTDQIEGVIDTRYRQMVNMHIVAEAVPEGFEYLLFSKTRYLKTWILPSAVAEFFYPIYDTLELVNPIDEKLIFDIASDKTETVSKVDEIVDKLLEIFPKPERITRGVVSDYCLRNRIPKFYVQPSYEALKGRILQGDI